MHRTPFLFLALATSLAADGLGDLKAALGRLEGTSPIKGIFEVKRWSRNGEGKEQTERAGQASALVEDGPQGLRMILDKGLMGKVSQETKLARTDPKAPTPATTALGAMTPRAAAEQLNAVDGIASQLEHAQFLEEKPEAWNGSPARLLTFKLSTGGMPESQKKYIKEYQGTAKVWISEDGTPLAANMKVSLKGRAFLVISFQQEQEESFTYQKVGNRLICIRAEEKGSGSGAGQHGQSHHVATFSLM